MKSNLELYIESVAERLVTEAAPRAPAIPKNKTQRALDDFKQTVIGVTSRFFGTVHGAILAFGNTHWSMTERLESWNAGDMMVQAAKRRLDTLVLLADMEDPELVTIINLATQIVDGAVDLLPKINPRRAEFRFTATNNKIMDQTRVWIKMWAPKFEQLEKAIDAWNDIRDKQAAQLAAAAKKEKIIQAHAARQKKNKFISK